MRLIIHGVFEGTLQQYFHGMVFLTGVAAL